jgi:hypothetical protein
MTFTLRSLLAALAAVAVLGAAATPTAAQDAARDGARNAGQEAAAPSDAKLRSFVTAVVAVKKTFARYQPDLAGAKTKEEHARLRQQAMGAMRKAVVDTDGITVAEYQAINGRVQRDEAFRSRVQKIADGMFKKRRPGAR